MLCEKILVFFNNRIHAVREFLIVMNKKQGGSADASSAH